MGAAANRNCSSLRIAKDETMNTYKWTCKACETPNIFIHDPDVEGQVALNCKQCGAAGQFEKGTVSLHYEKGEPFPNGLMSTCSTSLMSSDTFIPNLMVSEQLYEFGKPRMNPGTAPDPTFPTEEDLEYKRSHDKYMRLALEKKNGAKRRRWPWSRD